MASQAQHTLEEEEEEEDYYYYYFIIIILNALGCKEPRTENCSIKSKAKLEQLEVRLVVG